MKLTGKHELRELLAAEYALGTLRGGARRRFELWLRSDAGLRRLVAKWNAHFAPLAESLPERAPPQRVWDAIVARLPALQTKPPAGKASWWDSLAFWRGLALATSAVAALAIGIGIFHKTDRLVTEQVAALPSVIATITDQKTGAPLVFLMLSEPGRAAAERGNEVVVKVAEGVTVPDDKSLQLWMAPATIPKGTPAMVSLGILPATERAVSIKLSAADFATLRTAKALGLSLEPAGGSPQPTQVLGLGRWTRLAS